MPEKASILYIWKSPYPWDVRVEKICTALRDAGHKVTILARCKEDQLRVEYINDIEIIRTGCGKNYFLSNPVSLNPLWKKSIREAIAKVKPDIIIPREIMLAEAAAMIARKFDIPVIMDMAEHYPAAMKSWKKYSDDLIRRFLVHQLNMPERTEKRCVPLMDGIITVCEEQNKRLNKEHDFPPESMQVVHNTSNIDAFGNVRKGSNTPPKVFGHHGWMSSDKNILDLVHGFDIAANKHKEIELLLAGDGEDFEEISRARENAKNKDRIFLTGRYSPKELPKILSRIDAGCMTYELNAFNEHTLHNKFFDYLACGKVLLCSETPPFKRVIKETGAGIAEDCSSPEKIADAIDKVMRSDAAKFSENAEQAANEKYNWDFDKGKLISFINTYL